MNTPQIIIAAWLLLAGTGSLLGTWRLRRMPVLWVLTPRFLHEWTTALPVFPWVMGLLSVMTIAGEAVLLWAGGFWG